MTDWTKLSVKKPKFISEKQLDEENKGIEHTEAKWQPMWVKTKKVDDGKGKFTY